jgi:hypothetical protein
LHRNIRPPSFVGVLPVLAYISTGVLDATIVSLAQSSNVFVNIS